MTTYRPLDPWKICERTGFEVRSSQTTKEWNGLIVRDQSFETRHPQDFVRSVPDRQNVIDPRPEPVDRIVGPLVTSLATEALAGASTLNLATSGGMVVGDSIRVVCDADTHYTTIATIPSSTSITIAQRIPSSAARGNAVTDVSAITVATEGF